LSPGTAANDRSNKNFTSPLLVNDSIEFTGSAQASPRNNALAKKLGTDYNVSASIEIAHNVRNSFDHNRFSAT
jgi:hypothetical protein